MNRLRAAVNSFLNPPVRTEIPKAEPEAKPEYPGIRYDSIAEASGRMGVSKSFVIESVNSFISQNAPKALQPELKSLVRSAIGKSSRNPSVKAEVLRSVFPTPHGLPPAYSGYGGGTTINALASEYYAGRLYPGDQILADAANSGIARQVLLKPIRDAIDPGWTYYRKHDKIDPKFVQFLEQEDEKSNAIEELKEDLLWRDVYGIRVVIHKMVPGKNKFTDPRDFYKNPYEPEFVDKNYKYERLSNDPTWTKFDFSINTLESFLPSSPNFFEPPAWRVIDELFDKSHCTVMRCRPVAQLIKPLYQFGGLGYLEPMLEHLYRYETLLNEALALIKTIRTFAIKQNSLLASDSSSEKFLDRAMRQKDNHGAIVLNPDEDLSMMSTSLGGISEMIKESSLAVCATRGIQREIVFMDTVGGLNVNNLTGRNDYERECQSIRQKDANKWIRDRNSRKLEIVRDRFPDEYKKGFPSILWHPIDPFKRMEQADYMTKMISALSNGLAGQVLSPEQVDDFIVGDPDLRFGKPSDEFKKREIGNDDDGSYPEF